MAERTNATGNGGSAEDFGANAWLVDEMYKQYLVDKNSVGEALWPVPERFSASGDAQATANGATAPAAVSYTHLCV